MWKIFRVFKPAHAKVAEFCEGRTRLPDEDFLSACGGAVETEAARVALAVRRAVAAVGLVDPLFVLPDDSYPGELELLPLWDSMDWLSLHLELERELGTKFRCDIGDLFPESPPLTVKFLVRMVNELIERQRIAERSDTTDRSTGTDVNGQLPEHDPA